MTTLTYLHHSQRVESDSYTDSYTTVVRFKTDRKATLVDVIKAAKEKLETHCTHSYDCCGKYYASVYSKDVRKVKRGEFWVKVTYIRNI